MKSSKNLGDKVTISQFRELKHNILLKNNTSQTEIVDPSAVQLIELDERFVVLSLPLNSCGLGHLLSLYIYDHPMKQRIKKLPREVTANQRVISGRVQEINKLEEGLNTTVEITSSVDEWKKVIKLYVDHQSNISNLFEKKL